MTSFSFYFSLIYIKPGREPWLQSDQSTSVLHPVACPFSWDVLWPCSSLFLFLLYSVSVLKSFMQFLITLLSLRLRFSWLTVFLRSSLTTIFSFLLFSHSHSLSEYYVFLVVTGIHSLQLFCSSGTLASIWKWKVPELDTTGLRDVGKEPWRDDWTDCLIPPAATEVLGTAIMVTKTLMLIIRVHFPFIMFLKCYFKK